MKQKQYDELYSFIKDELEKEIAEFAKEKAERKEEFKTAKFEMTADLIAQFNDMRTRWVFEKEMKVKMDLINLLKIQGFKKAAKAVLHDFIVEESRRAYEKELSKNLNDVTGEK